MGKDSPKFLHGFVVSWKTVESARKKVENLSQSKSKTQKFKQLGMLSKKPSLKNVWPFNSKKNYQRTVSACFTTTIGRGGSDEVCNCRRTKKKLQSFNR